MFAPEAALAELRPSSDAPSIELTLDLMALSAMNAPRVQSHVQRAFDFGCRYFYTLLPVADSSDGIAPVRQSIERFFWPHPVPPRTEALGPVENGAPAEIPVRDYAHLVGWRRMRV